MLENITKFVKKNPLYLFIGSLVLIVVVFFGYQWWTSQTATKFSAPKVEAMSNKEAELILFFADWCPHCKKAKPEWESVKSEYEGKAVNGYNIVFTEYNCTQETPEIEELVSKYSIEGYPTIKLLKDNQIIEFDAKPTKSSLEQFLNTAL